ncbi:uncharacterized protein CIMG_02746 [Coccidioides immitis RS]|uniref:Uncharacterized protein n=1 Tax=Coccidioides immitis (strain RS) TaxID=246410 RepID=J3KM11_COCIM|nr:uncharacterized protein CIMG_02746 [Coccidioides immitis RS]EAS37392.3 hypothetical protein CIMG_02746 [Coccidioides immitis RS]
MVPNLALSKLEFIRDMINTDEPLTTSQMAEAAGRSKRAIQRIRSNLRHLRLFGRIQAPPNKRMATRSFDFSGPSLSATEQARAVHGPRSIDQLGTMATVFSAMAWAYVHQSPALCQSSSDFGLTTSAAFRPVATG